jgi:hypothetical protein
MTTYFVVLICSSKVSCVGPEKYCACGPGKVGYSCLSPSCELILGEDARVTLLPRWRQRLWVDDRFVLKYHFIK